MIVLGFDTSRPYCAACVISDGNVLARSMESMARGQAERLMPMMDELLAQVGLTWQSLDAIGVGVGPGNFTGIRISVAAARGLGLGLGVPVIGISGFEAAANGVETASAIDGPRNRVYLNRPGETPQLHALEDVGDLANLARLPSGDKHAERIARLALARLLKDPEAGKDRPAPLYIKAADAAPAKDAPPRIIP